MIQYLVVASLVVFTTGCSLFGDSLRDRSKDYLVYKQEPPATRLDGSPLSDGKYNPYPIANQDFSETLPGEFITPRPDPLVMQSAMPEDSVSLSEFRSTRLNPTLVTDGAGSLVLQLSGSFPNAWAQVAEALVEVGYKINDLNRSLGIFYLDIENPNKTKLSWWDRLWAEDEEYKDQIYLLKMSRNAEGVYLSLLKDMDELADSAVTQSILKALHSQLTR